MVNQPIIQPSKVVLLQCTIDGIPFRNSNGIANFHVQELRIYEDICKAYFTAQLVIETQVNIHELFVTPSAEVTIAFEAPRSDGKDQRTSVYRERFRIYSYESKPREGDLASSMIITLSLIGDEYYNDKVNTVQQNFSNIPGTAAAAQIHEAYIAENGGLRVEPPSLGMIGQDGYPHQVLNKKPIKAIHDILDKVVYASYKTCAPVYFRNKQGYVMAPLQYLLENSSVTNYLRHVPAAGASLTDTLIGYENVIHLRPMMPPGEDRSGMRGAEIDNMFKKSAFFDVMSGNYETNALSQFSSMASNLLQSKVKGKYGGRHVFTAIDEFRQARSVDKNGPGGFNVTEDAFMSALTYSEKYWISVPMQSGINTTVGERVMVNYYIGTTPTPQPVRKTLFVPRLIHELRFTEGPNRGYVTVNGTTDLYCLHWEG